MTTYYVDSTVGSSGNGLTTRNAIKTLAEVEALTLVPGDVILGKAGSVWREQFDMPGVGGTEAQPIVFGAYGVGGEPTILGSDDITADSWTNIGSNRWTVALTTEPSQVFFDDGRGSKEVSQAAVTQATEWFWESNVLTIYSTSDPSGAGVTIEPSQRSYGVREGAADWVTFKNWKVKHSNIDGFGLFAQTGWTLEGCIATKTYRYGLYANGMTRVTFKNCFSFSNFYGMSSDFNTNQIVEDCYFYSNNFRADGDGAAFNQCNGLIFQRNYSYSNDNGGSSDGLQIVNSADVLVTKNRIYDHGNADVIFSNPGSSGEISHNSIGRPANTTPRGIIVDSGQSNVLTIKNNSVRGVYSVYAIRISDIEAGASVVVQDNHVHVTNIAFSVETAVDDTLVTLIGNRFVTDTTDLVFFDGDTYTAPQWDEFVAARDGDPYWAEAAYVARNKP